MQSRRLRFASPCAPFVTALALSTALLFAPAVARASVIFPNEVESHLGLKSAPACTLCHENLSGGIGTAIKPFGVTVRANGAVAGSISSLDGALDAMKNKSTDSDGDCVGDIAELVAGTDPDNGGDNPGACGDGGAPPPAAGPGDPQYGCSAAGGSPGGAGGGAPIAGAVLFAWAWASRRRGARRAVRR
jgi:hypothetical protein